MALHVMKGWQIMIYNSKPIWILNTNLSDSEITIYSHSFPIKRDKITNKIVLSGEFLYNKSEGTVSINVYDCCNDTIYAPFYNNVYGNYEPILKEIRLTIDKEMKKVGLQCQ